MPDKPDKGPLWQIEHQIKHYEDLAQAFGEDAGRYTSQAEDARAMAARYREAYEALKSVGVECRTTPTPMHGKRASRIAQR